MKLLLLRPRRPVCGFSGVWRPRAGIRPKSTGVLFPVRERRRRKGGGTKASLANIVPSRTSRRGIIPGTVTRVTFLFTVTIKRPLFRSSSVSRPERRADFRRLSRTRSPVTIPHFTADRTCRCASAGAGDTSQQLREPFSVLSSKAAIPTVQSKGVVNVPPPS